MSDEKLKACAACGCLFPLNGNGHMCPTPTAEKADVVEAVARALFCANHSDQDPDQLFEGIPSWRAFYEDDAITAIAALQAQITEQKGESNDVSRNRLVDIDRARLALFNAVQAIKIGNPTDDKLILDNLREAGFWICHLPAEPAGEEPVRWLHKHPEYGEHVEFDAPTAADKADGWVSTPLYARPATPSNPDRLVGWRTIDSAPKDGRKILLWIPPKNTVCIQTDGYWVVGQWDENRHAKNPKPYWRTDDGQVLGTGDRRRNQPTAWMPLPAAPALDGEKGE